MDWESFDMIRSQQKGQIRRYRESADSVTVKDETVVFHYECQEELDLADKPTVAEVLINEDYFGFIQDNFRPHSVWGLCQNCASRKVAKATHRVSKRMGWSLIRCGACGTTGTVRFQVNNDNEYGWVKNRYPWRDAPKYRVTGSTGRCFKPSYRGLDEFFKIDRSVPCKRIRSIISVDHKPYTWVKDSGTAAGLFITDDGLEKWLETDHNPHQEIDFSKSEFSFPRDSVLIKRGLNSR